MINKIKILNGSVHNEFEINFSKGSIASIVGQNGHGKSQALNSIHKEGNNFINGEKTNRQISFLIGKEETREFESFTIFKSEFFNFKFEDVFDKEDWLQSITNLEKAIIEKIKNTLSSTDKNQMTKNLQDFENIIMDYEDEYVWTYLESICNEKQYLSVWLENKNELWETLDKMNQWNSKMREIIRYKNIIPSEKSFTDSRIRFKEDGNYDVRYSLDNDSTWFIKMISFLNLSNELKTFGKGISKTKDITKKLDNFNKKIIEGFSNRINQPNLDIMMTLSIEYDLEFNVNIEFKDNNNVIDYDSLSTGTQNFINVLFQLGNTDKNTIVTIDEPDIGLHPMYQCFLREELEKVAAETECRFVIATHSIYMLNKLNNRVNTYVSWKNEKGLFHLKNITEFHNLIDDFEGTQIWEMLGYNFLQEDINVNQNDKILLVEGDSDKVYIKAFFKLQSGDNLIKDLKIISMTGADKVKYQATYLNEVKDIKKDNIFILLDNNVNEHTTKFLSDNKFKFAKIGFDNIEDIFKGKNDKSQFTKKINDEYTKKLSYSLKFSINKSKLWKETEKNIESVKNKIRELIK